MERMSNLYVRTIHPNPRKDTPDIVVTPYDRAIIKEARSRSPNIDGNFLHMITPWTKVNGRYNNIVVNGYDSRILQLCIEIDRSLYVWNEWRV